MFDEIGAELQKAGHHIIRYAHRDAFAVTPDPLASVDILLCVAMFPLTRDDARRGAAAARHRLRGDRRRRHRHSPPRPSARW